MEETSLYLIILLILVLLSGYFSASETSFSSVNIVRLESMLQRKKKNQKHFSMKLTNDFTSTLSIILILNNIVNLTAASMSIVFFTKLGIKNAVIWSTIWITIIILVLGEFLPKVFAKRKPEWFAIHLGLPLHIIIIISKPITWLISLFVKNHKKVTTTEKELIRTLTKIEQEGELEKEESKLIKSALRFDDKTVKSVYTKWKNVIYLEHNWTIKESLKIILKEKHSRMPVLKKGKVIGFVSLVDMFGKSKTTLIENFIRPIRFISQNIHLDDALELMQKSKQHILVVTKYQKTQKAIGIITLEDLLEEIVGEIYDETDDIPKVMSVGHHGHLVDGSTNVGEVFTKLNATLPLIQNVSFYNWVLLTVDEEKITLDNFKAFKYDRFKIILIEERGESSVFQIIEE